MAKEIVTKILELADEIPVIYGFLISTSSEREKTTRYMYGEELKLFFEYLISYDPNFCNKTLQDITIEDLKLISSESISFYLSHSLDYGLKERTVARKRASISSFFRYLCDNKKLDYNPVSAASHVKIHSSDQVIHLTLEEQNKFIRAVFTGNDLDKRKQTYHNKYAYRDRAIVIMLLDTGMRNSELRGIDIQDVDFDECNVLIRRKGGFFQTLYFSDTTKAELIDYLQERRSYNPDLKDSDPLFVTLKGDRLSASTLQKLIKKYATSSIPGKGQLITPHKMRSSSAMEFYAETKDILSLQKRLGHKSLQATNIYAKATNEQMKEQRNIIGKKWNL